MEDKIMNMSISGGLATGNDKTIMGSTSSKYCQYCGKLKELMPTGYYDESTGKPFEKVCCMNKECESNEICTHNCRCVTEHTWNIFDYLKITNGRCKKCNKKINR
jgi:hypothetical protein